MNKKLSSFLGRSGEASKKSDQIQNRESWLKVIVIGAFALLLFYKIATSPFVFRFSDFISLFASLFALTISVMYYKKFNDLVRKLEERTTDTEPMEEPAVAALPEGIVNKNEEEPAVETVFLEEGEQLPQKDDEAEDPPTDNKQSVEVQAEQAEERQEALHNPEGDASDAEKETLESIEKADAQPVAEPEPLFETNEPDAEEVKENSAVNRTEQEDSVNDWTYYEPSEEDMKTQMLKEEELKQIEMDKTQIYQQLYTRANLNEEERKFYQEQLQEKEKQATNLKQELIQFTNRISQAINRTPQLFQKRDSRIEGIVRLLTPEFVSDSSLGEINDKLDELAATIPEETLSSLQREGYLDDRYHFTRSGYREAINASKLI
ncbi:hypothetical protein GA0061096_0433 [Fictibacillus enclensis]|uniref:Uncharacterized protein n=1 Tax=Fictibacillus enclensis TaxID=1017270 RepID=A0A0V8JBL0_9BACL|nr:hypothetical protein [Fictibacillus enclensis]KSU84361.1 hypothetical protein AS030_02020 [Fictibacillus enclensis]SCB77870.1 hypothetical protein GA0061096_0433 [Fictibacillus enclensis]